MAVTIQDDMWRVAKRLPREYRDRLIGALVAYGLDGELPDESEEGEPWFLAFEMACSRIDASVKRNQTNREMNKRKSQKAAERKSQRENPMGEPNGNSQREHPKGEPKDEGREHPYGEPNTETTSFPLQQPENENESESENENEVRKGESEGKAKASKRKRFVPPTPDQVTAFAAQEGLTLDAQDFCDYYASKGWVVGRGQPMKDWQAAARRWARSDYNKPAKSSPPPTSDPNLSFLDHLETVRVPAVSYTEVVHG